MGPPTRILHPTGPPSRSRYRPGARVRILAAGLLGVTIVDAVTADSFRCGRRVVRDGDTAAEVLERCGEPAAREKGYETLWLVGGQRRVRVERWRYRPGAGRLERIVLLHRGEVVKIRSGSR